MPILCRHAWHFTCLLYSSIENILEWRTHSHTHVIMYSAALPYTYPARRRALPCSYGWQYGLATGFHTTHRITVHRCWDCMGSPTDRCLCFVCEVLHWSSAGDCFLRGTVLSTNFGSVFCAEQEWLSIKQFAVVAARLFSPDCSVGRLRVISRCGTASQHTVAGT